jgi:hypothetical protein
VPQTTDAYGHYLFDDLPPGSYYVIFDLNTLPTGYLVTTPNQGNDQFDSDADPVTGKTDATGPLTTQSSDVNLDMGIYSPVIVGNRVWFDDNHDGVQQPTEAGVESVKVTLYNAETNLPVTLDATGNPVLPQITDVDGFYRFEGLPPGIYYVVFDLTTLPTGYRVTTKDVGTDDQLDSDVDPQSGKSAATEPIPAGGADVSLDMGIWAPVSIGDRVWYDINGNGIQETGETGIAGVKITLYDSVTRQPVTVDVDGKPIVPQTTDVNGNYLFANLLPGDYYVKFDLSTLPDGYKPTKPNLGSDDALDSDVDPVSGESAPTGPLAGGTQELNLDMGIYLPARVGGVVWDDGLKDQADGIKSPTEKGIPNVTVILTNEDGEEVASTVTDQNGNFVFEDLPPGDYWLTFVPPSGATYTTYVPTTEQTNSDPDPNTGRTDKITLVPGDNDMSWGAGFVPIPTSLDESDEPTLNNQVFLPIVAR